MASNLEESGRQSKWREMRGRQVNAPYIKTNMNPRQEERGHLNVHYEIDIFLCCWHPKTENMRVDSKWCSSQERKELGKSKKHSRFLTMRFPVNGRGNHDSLTLPLDPRIHLNCFSSFFNALSPVNALAIEQSKNRWANECSQSIGTAQYSSTETVQDLSVFSFNKTLKYLHCY